VYRGVTAACSKVNSPLAATVSARHIDPEIHFFEDRHGGQLQQALVLLAARVVVRPFLEFQRTVGAIQVGLGDRRASG
jgi:hypothetical protein